MQILKLGKSYFSSEVVDRQISAIYDQTKTIYTDVSDANIAAAKEALKSEDSRYNLGKCVEISIPHLVAAYTISRKALRLTKKTKFLFIFTIDEDLISRKDRPDYLSYLALLSGEISTLYRKIGQINNSKEWHDIAINDFQESLDLFYYGLNNLKSIDEAYVDEFERYDPDDEIIACHTERCSIPKHCIEITYKGEKFRNKEIEKKMNEFIDAISF